MSERELFECEFPKPKDIYWCEDLNDYNYIDKGRGNPYAYDNLISYRLAWKAWKTSANRQGYKLVPVEMSLQKADDLAMDEWSNIKELFKSQNKDLTAIQIQDFRLRWCRHKAEQIKSEYKIMIRAME